MSAGDPSIVGREEDHALDETYIRDLGCNPGAASVIRSKEFAGVGAVPMGVVKELHSLQELSGQDLPMLTAVPRTDQLWLAREVPPRRDPAARYVQERERELCVRVRVLTALGHFSPDAAGIGAMDNDNIHSS